VKCTKLAQPVGQDDALDIIVLVKIQDSTLLVDNYLKATKAMHKY
jgi:hypothetical protein